MKAKLYDVVNFKDRSNRTQDIRIYKGGKYYLIKKSSMVVHKSKTHRSAKSAASRLARMSGWHKAKKAK
jgi:hypothetical protein